MLKKILIKAIDITLGYPLYCLSFFMIRNPKKIVVGSHTPFNDNSKYFFLFSSKYLSDYKIIWITKSQITEKKIRKLNLEVYRKNSLKGLYHSLTAKFYIYSFHLHDINFWTSGGSIKFNLWHGIPLKDIAFAIKSGPSSKLYNEKNLISRIIRPHIFIRPDYMLTTSEKMSSYFAKAFRINQKQCLEFGMPRCEILSWKKEKILTFVKTYESYEMLDLIHTLQNYTKIYIYMPTWREEVDFLNTAGFDFALLNKQLKLKNMLFLFKLHPFTKLKKLNLDKINAFSNLLVLDSEMDIYPILPFTDCLITDYSSIYYDYLLCKEKEIYLYPYDYNHYINTNRNFAFDYYNSMPGEHLKSFQDLLAILNNNSTFSQEQIKIKKEYFGKNNYKTVERLCKYIKDLSH
jgi:CDP-glycerol glycerophosphotransferase (TagB/SpsB family)